MGFFSLTSDWCRLRWPLFPRGFGRGGGGFLLGGRGRGGVSADWNISAPVCVAALMRM